MVVFKPVPRPVMICSARQCAASRTRESVSYPANDHLRDAVRCGLQNAADDDDQAAEHDCATTANDVAYDEANQGPSQAA